MSSIKNDNPLNALGKLFETGANEVGRVANEASRHVTESINEIATTTEKEGFIAGGAKLLEKHSVGNYAAGFVDSIIPGEDLPPDISNGIALAVNLYTGNFIVAAIDGYQALTGDGLGVAADDAKQAGGQRMQTPEAPSQGRARFEGMTGSERMEGITKRKEAYASKGHSREELLAKAKDAAKEQLRTRATESKANLDKAEDIVARGGGYAAVADLLGDDERFMGGGLLANDIIRDARANDAAKKRVAEFEGQAAKANAELDKILNNPNLSFEDMVFLLMNVLVKQSQDEVKEMTKEMRNEKADFESAKLDISVDFDRKEAAVTDLEAQLRGKPDDPELAKKLGAARTELRKADESRNDKFNDFNDSRQLQLETLKNAINKITEMQQALSNVLNSMHQTAMNTIGNIR